MGVEATSFELIHSRNLISQTKRRAQGQILRICENMKKLLGIEWNWYSIDW
jgi:hypothetical protein